MKKIVYEDILEIAGRRPFLAWVWLFFFLLINRGEGRRLLEELKREMEELIQVREESNRALEKALRDIGVVFERLREARTG